MCCGFDILLQLERTSKSVVSCVIRLAEVFGEKNRPNSTLIKLNFNRFLLKEIRPFRKESNVNSVFKRA
jgi:hypothetical protein